MAIAACLETARGTGVSGKYGESFTFTRKWIVRVDSPSTPRTLIARAPGIVFGAGHPDFDNHKAMEFDCTEESGDGMVWAVTVKYYIPPVSNTPDDATGMPKDAWSASGSTITIPVFEDKDEDVIFNSAGDPLEGIERESTEFTLTLVKCYPDLAWSAIAESQSNTVNDASWNQSDPRTWKVAFRSASKKEATSSSSNTTKPYWETTWEFVYRKETWDFKPWDVGFNQRSDAEGNPTANGPYRIQILGKDKKPIKSPAALSNGLALPPGVPADVLEFKLYRETSFSVFGTPS
jgi:hypothetical protein